TSCYRDWSSDVCSADLGALKDKVVLVGATAQGTFDQRVTPFAKISAGIETHCNAIENMLAGTYLQRTTLVEGLEVVFLALLAIRREERRVGTGPRPRVR